MNEDTDSLFKEGYNQAYDLLIRCKSHDGFLATPTQHANYRRIWARDGVIIGLAALLTGDKDLFSSLKKTLITLAGFQGPHGEIPSNVAPHSGRVSYGGMIGRVDADLWFIIGCAEYFAATGDEEFISRMEPVLLKVLFLLGSWEFNNRGLLYIPQTGDWADEYLQHGFVLYDQLLYLQALRSLIFIEKQLHNTVNTQLVTKINQLHHLIFDNYWFNDKDKPPVHVYHKILYKKGKSASAHNHNVYWMPFFSPHGYGYRFDSFANILASLFHIADKRRREIVDSYIQKNIVQPDLHLLPAFHPVIKPVDDDWVDLQMTFSHTFKNQPYHYHNGGRWAMITGFYVADLAGRGQMEKARQYMKGIHQANRLCQDDECWCFPEFIHGRKREAGGNTMQGWSAAGTIIGAKSIEGKEVFRINENGQHNTSL